MKIKFYFDEMMPHAVIEALREHDYEVIMAIEVEMVKKDDLNEHLPYAIQHDLALVTLDHPFAGKASKQIHHPGVICWTGKPNDIGGMVLALSEFAEIVESIEIPRVIQ